MNVSNVTNGVLFRPHVFHLKMTPGGRFERASQWKSPAGAGDGGGSSAQCLGHMERPENRGSVAQGGACRREGRLNRVKHQENRSVK